MRRINFVVLTTLSFIAGSLGLVGYGFELFSLNTCKLLLLGSTLFALFRIFLSDRIALKELFANAGKNGEINRKNIEKINKLDDSNYNIGRILNAVGYDGYSFRFKIFGIDIVGIVASTIIYLSMDSFGSSTFWYSIIALGVLSTIVSWIVIASAQKVIKENILRLTFV